MMFLETACCVNVPVVQKGKIVLKDTIESFFFFDPGCEQLLFARNCLILI